ncbi:MAG: HlyD family efflux transporter periplasmic adaptor subunit [Clostridiales bacterium]|nr:HlyD family efflux transporter periplasmic adaptor subunit [Clostridiales bacterium]
MSETAAYTSAKPGRKKKRHLVRRFILWLVLLLMIALGGLYAYSRLKSEYTVNYDAYTTSRGSISNSLSFSGALQLVTSSTYTNASSATVRSIYVAEGDKVSKNTRLMRLSNGETIKADFDGTVNTVSVKVDDDVAANTNLIQIADFSHLKITIRIDEYDIGAVHVGDACIVTATATEKSFSSSISSINYISSSQGNVAYYTGTVYIDVRPEDAVYPGMQVTVTIPQEQAENVVILKMDALSFTDQNTAFVYKLDSDGTTMIEKPITVGVSNGNYVEIKEGLSEGEEVYVVAKAKTTSALTSVFSNLFGGQQINGGRGTRNSNRPSNNGSYGTMNNGGSAPGRGGY